MSHLPSQRRIARIVMSAAAATLMLAAVIAAPAAYGFDSPGSQGAPDLRSVRAKLKAGNYQAALTELQLALQTYQHPDVYNLMGFALRKSGDPVQAATWYRRALDADPNHKGALEYQGELFVQTGQMDKARENLARLTRLCPTGCEEQADLREAIEAAGKRGGATAAGSGGQPIRPGR